MFTLKFTTGIRPTERNMSIARAAQIYYHKGAYAEKPEQKADQKPIEQAEQKKPVEAIEKKPEQKKPVAEQKKPVEQAEQKKPVDQKKPIEQQKSKTDQKPVEAAEKKPKPVAEKKPIEQAEQKKPAEKPVEQKKPETKAEQKKPAEKPVEQKKPETKAEQQKPEDKKPETKAEQQKPEDQKKPVEAVEKKPVVEPVVEILDKEGNIVAMLPGVPEEAPKAARTTGTGFDINNFVKPPKQQQATKKNLGRVKNVDEVYSFIRNNAVLRPFDPMPGFSVTEKVAVLKKYANFNGVHPGLDVLQLNTLIMTFNSPDLSRKFISCGVDPKQVLGVKKFNEVPVSKYDNSDTYDFAFEYSIAKKKKLVLLVNSIPTYDEKQGWMNAYSISV